MSELMKINAFKHHIRSKICDTRSKYRRGRRETAVKVFTISDESKYLLIHNVPDIKVDVRQELLQLCQRFGDIEKLDLTDYPNCEPFSNTYSVKYKKFGNAVMAKKCLDDKNFLGSILHVCYAPELESINETKDKLNDRQRYVTQKLTQIHANDDTRIPNSSGHESRKSDTYSSGVIDSGDELNISSKTECNRFSSVSHKMSIESQTVIKHNKSETLKRKLSHNQSNEDKSLTKISKLSSDTPKIRWLFNKDKH